MGRAMHKAGAQRRRLTALLLALVTGAPMVAEAAQAAETTAGRQVLLVVQQASPQRAVDEAVRSHLAARGYRVSMADQAVAPASAAGMDLVVISSTVAAKDLDPAWRQLPVPLMTWENDALDDLAMTGKRHDTDFGTAEKERYLWVVNAPHAMAGGVPAGLANVYGPQTSMSWGKPGLGAHTIATIYGQPEKAAIFGYEKGATMDYETLAPARRTMFFLDNDSFTKLSPVGLRLFDAAVDWTAAGRPERP